MKLLAELAPGWKSLHFAPMHARWHARVQLGYIKRIKLSGRGWFVSMSGILKGTRGVLPSERNPNFRVPTLYKQHYTTPLVILNQSPSLLTFMEPYSALGNLGA